MNEMTANGTEIPKLSWAPQAVLAWVGKVVSRTDMKRPDQVRRRLETIHSLLGVYMSDHKAEFVAGRGNRVG